MAGNNSTPWSWLNSVAVPASLAVAESAWASLGLAVAFNSGTGPHVSLPFFAFAVPGVIAVVAGARCVRRRRVWWRQSLLLALVAVVGVMITAGLISQLSPSAAPIGLIATHPWDVRGHAGAVTTAAAWFVAAVAVGRGLWLGVAPPGFRQAVRSVGCGAVVFLAVCAGRAANDGHQFLSASANAGWLLFLWFPFVTVVIALIRQRDLERTVLFRTQSRPSNAWFAILAVPMMAVALLALLVAVVIGPAAPIVGRAVARAAVATADGVADAVRWLAGLIPKSHPAPVTPPKPTSSGAPPASVAPPTSTSVSPIVVTIVTVVLVIVAVIGLVLIFRHFRLLRPTRSKVVDEIVDDERDSVFSWAHLRAQVWAALRSLLRRLRFPRRRPGAGPSTVVVGDGEPSAGPESIRAAYRRFLRAARAGGQARQPTETTRELQTRLAEVAPVGGPALGELTDLYDRARYGAATAATATAATAAEHANTLTVLLNS